VTTIDQLREEMYMEMGPHGDACVRLLHARGVSGCSGPAGGGEAKGVIVEHDPDKALGDYPGGFDLTP
jgi:hypothetical protein